MTVSFTTWEKENGGWETFEGDLTIWVTWTDTYAEYRGGRLGNNFINASCPEKDYMSIYGGFGNDTIISGAGIVQGINASAGDDLIFVSDIGFYGSLTVDGGAGNDTVDYSSRELGQGSIVVNLATGVAFEVGGWASTTGTIKNVENVVGTNLNDSLTGNQAANLLAGGLGNDALNGNGGNDTLKGGDGDDVIFQSGLPGSSLIDGGSGFDTADYSGVNSVDVSIRADLAAGTIARQHTITLQQHGQTIHYVQNDIDTISNIEAVVGTGSNDFLNGVGVTAGPVALYGKGGNDVLFGSAGDDTLNGGAGNDSILAGSGDDRIAQDSWSGNDTINGGAGVDVADYSGLTAVPRVESHIVVNLGIDRIEKFQIGVVTGTDRLANDVEQVIGTAFNDVLYGDANANHLVGGAGNDTFSGAAGNDLLEGGSGNDLLVGGTGDDIINGGSGNDLIRLDGGGNDTFIFDSHFGQDSITRVNPVDVNGQDVVQFNGINAADILFQRQGDDLCIIVAASTDTLTLLNWYAYPGAGIDSPNFDVDQFQAGDVVLSADTVAQVVTIVGAAPVSMADLVVHSR